MSVDGLRVHYRDRGEGAAIVLLHGSYSSLHTWEGWSGSLTARHRVVALDLPGHGLTGPDPMQRYRPAAMADFVHTFASRLHLGRYVVAGNSMGGRVAAELALRHHDDVRGLILVDAAGLRHKTPKAIRLRLFESPFIDAVARWVTPPLLLRRALRDMYGDRSKITEAVFKRYEDLCLREGNRGAIRHSLDRNPRDDFEARLAAIRSPTLILWGALDRAIPAKHAERFRARIPGSRVVVFEGVGHVPMEEEPAGTAAEVLRFLDGIRG